MEVW
jgi:hypothetical protein